MLKFTYIDYANKGKVLWIKTVPHGTKITDVDKEFQAQTGINPMNPNVAVKYERLIDTNKGE